MRKAFTLETAIQQAEDKRIKQALLSVKDAIEKGEPLHTAFGMADIRKGRKFRKGL